MDYTVEDISPVKKKIHITVDPQEVEAAIMATIAVYRTTVQIDGFRKGKVPASVIEARFRDKIYEEAKQDLVNMHINEVVQALGVTPVSGIDFDGKEMLRDVPYIYSISFETLPVFDLPPYEGVEVVQEKAVVKDSEVEEVIARILKDRAELVPAEGNGPAVDGQTVTVDFAAFENGQPLEGIQTQNFQLPLGENQALADFEALVKTVPLGQSGEGDVRFPDDFVAPDLAGKTATFKVSVNAIKDRKIPEITDELAKTLGQESAEGLRTAIVGSYMKSREALHKGTAQKTLLDSLLKMVDFPLPDAVVDGHLRATVGDRKARIERQGKNLAALGTSEAALAEELRGEAEATARAQVFLLTVARKEQLEVSEQEVNMAVYQLAQQSGQEFKQLKDACVQSGAIFTLRDRLMADKAMEAIYAKAVVVEKDVEKDVEKE